uniref:Uncharacterized protein n=1 Tax=Rhizophora mucronata TaxID=61149 RepID=A0A2P2IMC9_RHIMU
MHDHHSVFPQDAKKKMLPTPVHVWWNLQILWKNGLLNDQKNNELSTKLFEQDTKQLPRGMAQT